MVKQRHSAGRKTMIIYGDNAIYQQITFNVSSDPKDWFHSSVRKNHKILQNITINNGDRGSDAIVLGEEK